MFQLLQDETAGTFTHDETVTAGTERATGLLRLIIAGRQGLHGVEASDTRLTDGSLGTTGNDDVGLT